MKIKVVKEKMLHFSIFCFLPFKNDILNIFKLIYLQFLTNTQEYRKWPSITDRFHKRFQKYNDQKTALFFQCFVFSHLKWHTKQFLSSFICNCIQVRIKTGLYHRVRRPNLLINQPNEKISLMSFISQIVRFDFIILKLLVLAC